MSSPIPPRPQGALTGDQIRERILAIMGDTQKCDQQELERRRAQLADFVFQQVTSGNVPDFMRPENYRTVTVETRVGNRTVSATFRVCPDYLAIGPNNDFTRMPLDPLTAQRIADRFGLAMPTQRMTDIIDAEAAKAGGTMPFVAAPAVGKRVTDPHSGKSVESNWHYQAYGNYEGRWMLSGEFIIMQNRILQESPESVRNAPIRSGLKKDVIYDPFAFQESHEGGPPVVIYRRGVQGLSNWHNEKYFDYSHGIRFLDSEVIVTERFDNGSSITRPPLTMREVLMHKDYHTVLSPVIMDIGRMYRHAAQAVPQRTGLNETQPPDTHTRRRTEPQKIS